MGPDGLFFRKAAHFGAARMPRWFARHAPGPIGALLCPFLPSARRAIVENQRRMFGRRSAVTEYLEASRTLSEYAACLSESLGASRLRPEEVRVDVEGFDRLDALLAEKTGIVVVTAHVGPWEGAALSLSGRSTQSVVLVMEAERKTEAAEFEDQLRRQRGLGVLRLGESPLGALPLLEHLGAGGIVAIQMDRPTRSGPVVMGRLFGRPFAVPQGPFRLAALTDAPILPVFAARLGHFHRLVVIGEPVWPQGEPGQGKRARWLSLIGQVLPQLEAHLRRFPRQWFHFVPPQAPGVPELGAATETRRRRLEAP